MLFHYLSLIMYLILFLIISGPANELTVMIISPALILNGRGDEEVRTGSIEMFYPNQREFLLYLSYYFTRTTISTPIITSTH